jgi:ATP-dependent DNA ligase
LRDKTFLRVGSSVSRVVERSASPAAKSGPSRRGSPLPRFIPPQLSQPVEKPPSGSQWLHEIKLDGFRVAARIDHGRAQLLTRTGLDWADKYPSVIAALTNVNAKTAYIDGELCGVDDAGLPSFAHTQAASDGERGVRLVYYAFDLLHLETAPRQPLCRARDHRRARRRARDPVAAPLDRMLVAQAIIEGVTLLTADPAVARYPGPIRLV